jgi:hypothetical protein
MTRLINASGSILRIVVIGSLCAGLLISALGLWLVYLGATGATEFSFFGQTLKSLNVGVPALFIGAVTIVLLLRRSLKSLDQAVALDARDGSAGKSDELVAILQDRARRINRDLKAHYKYADVKGFLRKFNALHSDHINALTSGQLMRAHEIARDIHALSRELERSEFWKRHQAETPDVCYSLGYDIFDHGPIVNWYFGAKAAATFTRLSIFVDDKKAVGPADPKGFYNAVKQESVQNKAANSGPNS